LRASDELNSKEWLARQAVSLNWTWSVGVLRKEVALEHKQKSQINMDEKQ
jgi:hypothetical protein